MAKIPTTGSLSEILKSNVETNTAIVKTIVKGSALYATAAIIAIPLYFKATTKLYSGFIKFSIKNIGNFAGLYIFSKIFNKVHPLMVDNILKINELYQNTLLDPKIYIRGRRSAKAMINTLNKTVEYLTQENKITLKDVVNGAANIITYKTLLKYIIPLTQQVGEFMNTQDSAFHYWRARLRVWEEMKLLQTMVACLVRPIPIKIGKENHKGVTIKDAISAGKNFLIYKSVLKAYEMLNDALFNKIMPELMKLSKRKFKKAKKGLDYTLLILHKIIDILDDDKIKSYKLFHGIKTAAKLFVLGINVVLLAGILTVTSTFGIPAIVGAAMIAAITTIFLGLFKLIELMKFDKSKIKSIKLVSKAIAAFITAWIGAKIAKTVAPIGAVWKEVAVGSLVIVSITLLFIGLFALISVINKKVDYSSIKVVMEILVTFVGAWAGAKIAETIAPIGGLAKEVFVGALVICGLTIMFVGLFLLVNLIMRKAKDMNTLKVAIETINIFVSAWVAANIVESFVGLGKHAKEIFAGALVICGVTLLLVGTFWLVQKMVKPAKMIAIALALVALSLAVVGAFALLAFALIFAPFAIITMVAVVLVAGMVWVIGKMFKGILKGAIAMLFVGMAMSEIAVPMLVFGITAAILAAVCGSPQMILTVMLSIVGFILAMSLITMLVGVLMNTGYFEAGIIGLGMLGLALLALTLPLLSIAIAMKIISETKLEEGAFKSLMEEIVKGLGVFLENPKIMNPLTLGFIMMSMAPLMGIMIQVSIMARTLQYLSSLKIPTEWDAKGRPTAFKKMETSDFVAAGMNAAAILSVASAIFADEDQMITFGDGSTAIIPALNRNALESISSATRWKVRRLKKIVGYVGGMARTLQRMSLLVVPDEEKGYDDKGNPKAWRQMKTQDFVGASINAATILSFFTALFGEDPATLPLSDGSTVSFDPISQASLENLTLSTKWKMQRLNTIVGCVGDMASTLQGMANLTIDEYDEEGKKKGVRSMKGEDFTNAAIVAANLLTFFTKLWSENDVESGDILGTHYEIRPIKESELENITKSTKRKMERLGVIIHPISEIVRTIVDAANLRIPIYKDGKMVEGKTRAMKPADFARASFNVQRMIRLTLSWIGNIDKDLLDAADDKADDLKDVMKVITGVLGSTTGIITSSTKSLNEIDSLYNSKGRLKITEVVNTFFEDMVSNVPSQWNTNARSIQGVLGALSGIDSFCEKIAKGTNTLPDKNTLFIDNNYRTKVSAAIESYVKAIFDNVDEKGGMKAKAFADVANSSNMLLEKINKTDAGKLKTAYHLVHDLAKFSQSIQGNFDKLADTINEKLIDALEKLKEVLEDTNEALDKKGTGFRFDIDSKNDNQPTDNTTDKSTKPDKNAIDNILNQQGNTIRDIQNIINELKNTTFTVKPKVDEVWITKEKS